MTILFKRPLLFLVLSGRKTQTRRTSRRELQVDQVYNIADGYVKPAGKVRITCKYRQRLRDITVEEIHKEGFNSLEELQAFWKDHIGNWNPEQTVTVYEFELAK